MADGRTVGQPLLIVAGCAEGDVFLERARTLLEALSAAEAEITERSAEAIGRLRINVPASFGVQHLSGL